MTKKKWIIIGAVVLALVGIFLAVVLWLIPALSQPEGPEVKNTPKQVVKTVMKALMGDGTTERVLLGADGTPVGISAGSGIAKIITSRMTYEITALDMLDEKTALASLEISAPDAQKAVKAALDGMEYYDETIFTENMRAKLETMEHTLQFSVQVELVLVEDRWCLVTNPDFSDAITGGLVTSYAQIQQDIMDAFAGGGEA